MDHNCHHLPVDSNGRARTEDGVCGARSRDGHGVGFVAKAAGATITGSGAAAAAAPAAIAAMGYTSTGISGGSLAATIMSIEAGLSGGGVAAGGFTATLQSIGAVGMSAGLLSGVALVGGAMGLTAAFLLRPKRAESIGVINSIRHGNVIALYSVRHGCFLRVEEDGRNVNGLGEINGSDHSALEKFIVIDVGNGMIALYNHHTKSVLGMHDNNVMRSVVSEDNDFVKTCQAFEARDAGEGELTLFSRLNGRFIRMTPGGLKVDGGAKVDRWERFAVVLIETWNGPN